MIHLRTNQKIRLAVMRSAALKQVPPQPVSRICSDCSELVTVYPSGQQLIEFHGETSVTIVCNVCQPSIKDYAIVPGALNEISQIMRDKS